MSRTPQVRISSDFWENTRFENSGQANPGKDYREWKESIVKHFITPNVRDKTFLDLGVGHGRWASYVVGWANRSILVDHDISCIDFCRNRFGRDPYIQYITNTGYDLRAIHSQSVDFIWAFDLFTNSAALTAYIPEMSRVLTLGGRMAIHVCDQSMDPLRNLNNFEVEFVSGWGDGFSLNNSEKIVTLKNNAAPVGVSQPGRWIQPIDLRKVKSTEIPASL